MQGRYWLLTIPKEDYDPNTNPDKHTNGVQYIRGQLEKGDETGFLHWQVLVAFKSKVRLARVKTLFGTSAHCELTRSKAADDYVWKEDTAVADTRFESGKRATKRNCSTDWDDIWDSAKAGNIMDIDASIRVTHYKTLRNIEKDFLKPIAIERSVNVYWGITGTGKSRRAWDEAGLDAFPKDPRTKFWDGYQGHEHVVIDEFRGDIDIAHMLRWLDRYPVIIEIKCGATVFKAKKIWITSNKDPREWYPNADASTQKALLRRLNITYFGELNKII